MPSNIHHADGSCNRGIHVCEGPAAITYFALAGCALSSNRGSEYEGNTITKPPANLQVIDTSKPVWDHFFTVCPLVLIGTKDEDGDLDLAPKHMVAPMGWENYFGFVCSPRHATCTNIARSGEFTVSYPKPDQLLYSSLAASPRDEHGDKPVLLNFVTFDASRVDGKLISGAYLFFECEHFKTIDGFGDNCMITGKIVAAYAEPGFIRASEYDDQELIHDSPLLAYLAPGRFASIDRSNSFPFPADMKK